MGTLFTVDWKLLFTPDTPLLEIIIRGTVLYFVIFFIIRLIPSRQIGGVGVSDMLLIVLVASGGDELSRRQSQINHERNRFSRHGYFLELCV